LVKKNARTPRARTKHNPNENSFLFDKTRCIEAATNMTGVKSIILKTLNNVFDPQYKTQGSAMFLYPPFLAQLSATPNTTGVELSAPGGELVVWAIFRKLIVTWDHNGYSGKWRFHVWKDFVEIWDRIHEHTLWDCKKTAGNVLRIPTSLWRGLRTNCDFF